MATTEHLSSRVPRPQRNSSSRSAGEGRMGPVALGPRFDLDHVHVPHQQHRRRRRVGPFPGVEKGVLGDHLAPQVLVDQRVGLLQEGVEGGEGGRIGAGAVLVADGGEAHRGGQVLQVAIAGAPRFRHRRHLGPPPARPPAAQGRRRGSAHPGAGDDLDPLLPAGHGFPSGSDGTRPRETEPRRWTQRPAITKAEAPGGPLHRLVRGAGRGEQAAVAAALGPRGRGGDQRRAQALPPIAGQHPGQFLVDRVRVVAGAPHLAEAHPPPSTTAIVVPSRRASPASTWRRRKASRSGTA